MDPIPTERRSPLSELMQRTRRPRLKTRRALQKQR
jgi:hypothetical protein